MFADRQGFRLPWHSFVRVQIYYKYRLSINRKNKSPICIFHSAVVSALASRAKGRGIESRNVHFPQSQVKLFIFSSSFGYLFYFSQFWSKTMCEYIFKVRQYRICNGKEAKLFYFSKLLMPYTRAKQDTLRGFQDFYPMYMLVSRWKWPCTWWQILCKGGKKLRVLALFLTNDNYYCFWYTCTGSFNWKTSFVLIYYKSEDGYPNFLFSYLLLIALYTNSTYIIWPKKYSVEYKKRLILRCVHHFNRI